MNYFVSSNYCLLMQVIARLMHLNVNVNLNNYGAISSHIEWP